MVDLRIDSQKIRKVRILEKFSFDVFTVKNWPEKRNFDIFAFAFKIFFQNSRKMSKFRFLGQFLTMKTKFELFWFF